MEAKTRYSLLRSLHTVILSVLLRGSSIGTETCLHFLVEILSCSSVFKTDIFVALYLSGVQSSSSDYPYSCTTLSNEGINVSGTYNVWPLGPTGSSYTVYCDMTTDGGGWMLSWAYNHIGGDSVSLVSGRIPTSPTSSYSHVNVEDICSSADEISEVRFY
jgi:hypothetical protein